MPSRRWRACGLPPARRSSTPIRVAVTASGAPQAGLIGALLKEVDKKSIKVAEPYGPHDGKLYGGGSRRKLKPSSKKWKAVAAEVAEPARVLVPLHSYDFATGEVIALPVNKGAEARLVENALLGFAPDLDLAEALVLQRLDADGYKRKAAKFFEHTYVDLKNKAYPGISLFDVWSHEIPVDVPDIDVRAYAHLVYDDEALPPVLKGPDQQLWYPRMAESLFAYRRHVLIARAIAATWLDGRPILSAGYEKSIDTMHATFVMEGGKLDAVAKRFRDLGESFVEKSLDEVNAGGGTHWNAGNSRRDGLAHGRTQVRAATIAVLRSKGYL